MNTDLVLPEIAWEGVDAGAHALLDSWFVQPGAQVQAGDAVARAVLVKSTLDVIAPVSGRLMERLVGAGETFARGQPIAQIAPSLT